MSRCAYCRHLIWPWQRRGWLVTGFERTSFHARCWSEGGWRSWFAEDAA